MTARFTFIIAALGAALVVALPAAFGKSQPVQPQWMKALEARGEALNRQHGLGEHSPSTKALVLRSEALNRQHGLGEYATSSSVKMLDGRERAFAANDDRFRIDATSYPTQVTATSSDNEIGWSRLGIGFGLGIALMLGIGLVLRYAGNRPLAHS